MCAPYDRKVRFVALAATWAPQLRGLSEGLLERIKIEVWCQNSKPDSPVIVNPPAPRAQLVKKKDGSSPQA